MTTTAPDALLNPVKAKLEAGLPAFGLLLRIVRSPDIARIAKATGHDFIFVDTQHSIYDIETISQITQTALALRIATLVRVRNVDDPDVSLLLDNGVAGIVFPDVNTVADARKAVALSKFPPTGRRTVVGGYPHFDYRPVPLRESVPQLNAFCLVVCMIETLEGLGNVEEIASVSGVDVLFVGSNDLLANMGKPGQFDDPDIVAAQDRVIKAALANGIHSGCGGNRDSRSQADAVRRGALFITTHSDVGLISSGAGAWIKSLRSELQLPEIVYV